jgi:hypothetical protein
VIDLATDGTLLYPRGINFEGSSTGPSDRRFGTLIIRKNVIRDFTATSSTTVTSGLYGIKLADASQFDVEDNSINNADVTAAVFYQRSDTAKTFNNLTSGGVLLRAYNGTSYLSELQDLVNAVPLVLFYT